MLYLIHGEDSYGALEYANSLVSDFQKKENCSLFLFDEANFSAEKIVELTKEKELFGARCVVFYRGTLEKDFEKILLARAKDFSSSFNVFIFAAGDLDKDFVSAIGLVADEVKKFNLMGKKDFFAWLKEKNISPALAEEIFEKCGTDLWRASREIEKINLSKGGAPSAPSARLPKKESFNVFHLCDAVAARDRKKAWILFNKALFAGVPAEELFYKILWQFKNILLVKFLSRGKCANLSEEAGLHPFVLKKTLSAAGKFSEQELAEKSFTLVELFHRDRMGDAEMSIGLEKFLIGI